MFASTRVRSVVLSLILVVGLGVLPAAAEEGDIIVHLRIRGPLAESPPATEFNVLFGGDSRLNMFDLLKTLGKMRSDTSVRAVVLDVDEAQLGIAQIQEIRAQIEKLRAADKDVWCYTEQAGLGTYLLASAATKLVMMPRGLLDLRGIHSASMYFKGLLDKIGVTADVVHCGAFKAAGEPFSRTGPSKEAEQNMNELLDGIFNSMIEGIAKSRRMSPEKIRHLFDASPHSAEEARKLGLVDALNYREDFVAGLKKRYGPGVRIVHNYGKKSFGELDFDNPFAVFKLFGDMLKKPKEAAGRQIAVIYVESLITTGRSEDSPFGRSAGSDTLRKAIDDAAKDDKIKAVVMRVDSPGGSAVASEIIAEAAKRLKSGKPLVVSMGDVAGSGGYYVSCLADCIFAEPGTITGSIGVIGLKFVTADMWEKIGISQHEYKRGEQADMMSSMRPWTEEQRARIGKMMNRVYGEFKDRVVEGRGKKLKGDIESLAGGRVYAGSDALEAGLVDRLGGLADAIKYAADQANVSKYELCVLPRAKSFLDILSESLGSKDEDDISLSVNRGGAALMGAPFLRDALPILESLDPQGVQSLRAGFFQIQALRSEHILMITQPVPSLD